MDKNRRLKMKICSINAMPFRGMILGKNNNGVSTAVNTREIDKVEEIKDKETQVSRYSYDDKKYIPIATFNSPIDAVLKAYSSSAKDDNAVAKI